jgi:hypothetical protein
VAATGVGPQAAAMVFGVGPLLQQHFAFVIEYKNAERAMQYALEVRLHFFHRANRFVLFVNQNYFPLCSHAANFCFLTQIAEQTGSGKENKHKEAQRTLSIKSFVPLRVFYDLLLITLYLRFQQFPGEMYAALDCSQRFTKHFSYFVVLETIKVQQERVLEYLGQIMDGLLNIF